MDEKFVVTPLSERSVTMTIRIDKELNNKLEKLSVKSGRSRNELINRAIKFALDKLEFVDNKTK